MDFICMDLIGKFHPPTSHGHHYALTAVCMLTGLTWCVPLKTKTAEEVSKAYLDHIYSNFGGSIKIMMDNGTEFKNKLFKEVVKKLGTEFSIHSPPLQTTEQWEDRRIPQVPENMASTSTTDWSGMSSHQWQQHVIISFQTAMPGNQHSSLCLAETQSTNSTCYYTQQEDTFTQFRGSKEHLPSSSTTAS